MLHAKRLQTTHIKQTFEARCWMSLCIYTLHHVWDRLPLSVLGTLWLHDAHCRAVRDQALNSVPMDAGTGPHQALISGDHLF